MKPKLSCLLWLVLIEGVLILSGAAEDMPILHDPSVHVGSGLKKELIAGISESDFLKLGAKPQTMRMVLVCAFTDANTWMNFNGYSYGQATYVIPANWTVEVTFINPSPVAHSAVLVEREMVKRVQVGPPAFEGASTLNPNTGISTGQATFSFLASTPGKYAFACGMATHAASGHWVAVEVSSTAITPTLRLGDAPPREAK